MSTQSNIKQLTGMFKVKSRQGRNMLIGTSTGKYAASLLAAIYKSAVMAGVPEEKTKKLKQALQYVANILTGHDLGVTFFLTQWAKDEPPKLACAPADPERQKGKEKKDDGDFFGDTEEVEAETDDFTGDDVKDDIVTDGDVEGDDDIPF